MSILGAGAAVNLYPRSAGEEALAVLIHDFLHVIHVDFVGKLNADAAIAHPDDFTIQLLPRTDFNADLFADLMRRIDVRHDSACGNIPYQAERSEEHTSELQSLMRISYAVFCLKKKTNKED